MHFRMLFHEIFNIVQNLNIILFFFFSGRRAFTHVHPAHILRDIKWNSPYFKKKPLTNAKPKDRCFEIQFYLRLHEWIRWNKYQKKKNLNIVSLPTVLLPLFNIECFHFGFHTFANWCCWYYCHCTREILSFWYIENNENKKINRWLQHCTLIHS